MHAKSQNTYFDICDLENYFQNRGWHPSTPFPPSYEWLTRHGILILTNNAVKSVKSSVGWFTVVGSYQHLADSINRIVQLIVVVMRCFGDGLYWTAVCWMSHHADLLGWHWGSHCQDACFWWQLWRSKMVPNLTIVTQI